MLTSLLPGFRHFRTPFALGVLIAFQVWILIGEYVPSRSEAQGFIDRVYALGSVAGSAAVTAAISFLLYLVGDIVRLSSNQMMGILSRLKLPQVAPHRFATLSAQSKAALFEFASTAFKVRKDTASDDDFRKLRDEIVLEFTEIRMGLIANHLDVYLEHDRFDAEADFRLNVGFYSTSLWPILAWCWTPWALLGILASVVLFGNGLRALRDANEILVQAIVSGIASSRVYIDESERDFPRPSGSVTIAPRARRR
ncbi:hypothetical protein [Streptomyces erythrochromogenes]|uniref:hypothetical protein n=1 Tax=Streptomyces erythrochromogenes TaxID=285574 RepID=UPI0037F44BF8